MKNKIILAIFCLILTILLTGCSCNMNFFDLDYEFNKAIVYENGEYKEYSVEKWKDYDGDMVCIWTKDGKIIYTSSKNIVLIKEGS